MTSKERMLCAINKEKPDRLPVAIHQWQPYHLNKYMKGMSDIEANKTCGLDAAINFYEEIPTESKDWRVSCSRTLKDGYSINHYTIQTPEGVLTTSEGVNPMTTWVMEYLVKKEEDIQLIKKYRPIPKLNRKKAIETYDTLGEDGILRTFLCGKQGGCWQDACELFGAQNLILATFDNPDWVTDFLQILLEEKLIYIEENLYGLPFDLIETGGGASSNTIISPDIHKEFCLPFDTRIHDALHKLKFKVVYHTCGGMTKILDYICDNHCDVSETLSPAGIGGDIGNDAAAEKVFEKLHPRVAMIGGMDQINILEAGNKQEIELEVDRLFHLFGRQGGYIMSACDHFFEVPPQNLKYFAEAAKNYCYSLG